MAFWTHEQDSRLRKLHGAKASFREIAATINAEFQTSYSRNATIGRALRLGLKCDRKKTDTRKRQRTPQEILNQRASLAARLRMTVVEEVEEATLRCAEVAPYNLSIFDLGSNDCRYPYGEGSEITFCGHPKADGSSYCESHFKLTRRSTRTVDEAVTEARARRMRAMNHRRMILEAAE